MSVHSSTLSAINEEDNKNNITTNIPSPTSPSPPLPYKTEKYSFPSNNCIVDIVNQQTIQNSGKKLQHSKIQKLVPIRFIILAISLFCFSILIANALALNFTVICMNKEQQMLSDEQLSVKFFN